ncbi:hypothetical protein KL943_005186 [Ogataea angusta]|nr:hypothetical protein KL943_005186 [Ogataea angusta]
MYARVSPAARRGPVLLRPIWARAPLSTSTRALHEHRHSSGPSSTPPVPPQSGWAKVKDFFNPHLPMSHLGGHSHSHAAPHAHSHGADASKLYDTKDWANEGVKITWVGLGVNVAMAVSKFAGGLYFHSQALIADAVHARAVSVWVRQGGDARLVLCVGHSAVRGAPDRLGLAHRHSDARATAQRHGRAIVLARPLSQPQPHTRHGAHARRRGAGRPDRRHQRGVAGAGVHRREGVAVPRDPQRGRAAQLEGADCQRVAPPRRLAHVGRGGAHHLVGLLPQHLLARFRGRPDRVGAGDEGGHLRAVPVVQGAHRQGAAVVGPALPEPARARRRAACARKQQPQGEKAVRAAVGHQPQRDRRRLGQPEGLHQPPHARADEPHWREPEKTAQAQPRQPQDRVGAVCAARGQTLDSVLNATFGAVFLALVRDEPPCKHVHLRRVHAKAQLARGHVHVQLVPGEKKCNHKRPQIHLEELLDARGALHGQHGDPQLRRQHHHAEPKAHVRAPQARARHVAQVTCALPVRGEAAAEADQREPDRAPREQRAEPGQREQPREQDLCAVADQRHVAQTPERQRHADGHHWPAALVDKAEAARRHAGLRQRHQRARRGVDSRVADRQDRNQDRHVHDRREHGDSRVADSNHKRRAVGAPLAAGHEPRLVVRHQQPDQCERADVEEQDSPEHLFGRLGDRLDRVWCFCCAQAAQLCAAEAERRGDKHGDNALEACWRERARVFPVAVENGCVVGHSAKQDHKSRDQKPENSNDLGHRKQHLGKPVDPHGQHVDQDHHDEKRRDQVAVADREPVPELECDGRGAELERQQHQPLHHVVPADGEAPARVDERGGVVRERPGNRKVARELGQRVHHAEHHDRDERVADQNATGAAVSERLGGPEEQAGSN